MVTGITGAGPGWIEAQPGKDLWRGDVLMKTDTQLMQDVLEELAGQPSVTASGIGVAVHNGVVTLSGTVPTFAEKCAAEQAIRQVVGIRAIAEEIQVKPTGVHKRSDEEVAAGVVRALQSHVWVPTDVQATVEKGWVTLRGQVTWQFQRDAATNAVRYLAGVKGVSNDVTLRPREPAAAVERVIEEALERNAILHSNRITVAADGGNVILMGAVRTWAERDAAEQVAWSAPGVTRVDNRLVVLCA
jgi:osmotically-inducible protein OsmY